MNHEGKRATLLIVDDYPNSVTLIAEVLRREYDVLTATTGREALRIAAECLPDLILLDVVMPEIDGYEVCRRLRASEATKNIPVIFITAKISTSEEEYGLNLGAADYITKPFELPIVLARVRNNVNLKLKTDLLESLVALDGLTGIPNRRRFDEVMETEWKRAMRNHTPLSLIMADVDHFKLYNDHYGHGAGDNCLKQVAKALASSLVRSGDVAARYGGEEFAVILPETDAEGARIVAERIRSQVGTLAIPHIRSTIAEHVTVSVGCSTFVPPHKDTWGMLVEATDRMLYQAKNNGRNQVGSSD